MYIHHLQLYTSNLQEQKQFYTQILRAKLIAATSQQFTLQLGRSQLTFEERKESKPYHFAFNIPSYQEVEAWRWLQERVPILKDEEAPIVDFPNWNAKAIYFYDADGNIVELIARRDLNYPSTTSFSVDSILEISEIGVPTDDVEPHYDFLHQNLGAAIYSGSFGRFCAVGEETALFILVNHQLKKWFPTNETAYPMDFKISIKKEEQLHHLVFEENRFKKNEL